MRRNELTAITGTALVPRELSSLAEAYIRALDVREGSRRTYQRALRRFTRWISEKGIGRPTREDILAYKRDLEGEVLPTTLSSYLGVVRGLFRWMETSRLYPDVARGIKGAKRARGHLKDPLTPDQARKLLESIDRSSLNGKRDYALLNLLIRTGLRDIETARANIGDIRQEGGEAVLWIQGKGRDEKDELVLLVRETLEPIREYLKCRGKVEDDAPLFVSVSTRNGGERLTTRSISRIVKERLRGIGIDDRRITAHSLRHTAITLSLLGGATVQEAQVLGRHADINTTLIYAHNIIRTGERAPERMVSAMLRV